MNRSALSWLVLDLLVCTVLVAVIHKAMREAFGPGSPPAPFKTAVAEIGALEEALEMFRKDNGFYPTGINVLSDLVVKPRNATPAWHQYLNQIRADPWGHAYRYEYPGRHNTNSFDLSSAGPDGMFGTKDDIVNWQKSKPGK